MRQSKPITREVAIPQSHQLVLILRDGLNLTFEQISVIMMLPVDAVRHLFAAAQHKR